ncbi:hypothetical protein DMH01_03415 [Amycolatopsis sp. WAC 04182]|uniref:hypothetical protein n=1 Tax=Amycolatopsis sp. WAC 04182 TaxID=2203198 RepID=UPI000F768709|nr:hypothetical protein [Amycolatopsis sp. WAC 04182]RSN65438.1 hypothetical protein DMH01_03415 [Amycolatopsis sp. WAC 04182]
MAAKASDGSTWKANRLFLKLKSEYIEDGYWWEVVDSTGTVALCSEQDDKDDDAALDRAAWIALMGPDKAEVLAAWLENAASWLESGEPFPYVEAESFARSILEEAR